MLSSARGQIINPDGLTHTIEGPGRIGTFSGSLQMLFLPQLGIWMVASGNYKLKDFLLR